MTLEKLVNIRLPLFAAIHGLPNYLKFGAFPAFPQIGCGADDYERRRQFEHGGRGADVAKFPAFGPPIGTS